MRINKKRSKKPVVIIALITVLATICIAVYLWFSFSKPQDHDTTRKETTKTKEQKKTPSSNNADSTEDTKEKSTEVVHEEEKPANPPYEGENPNSAPALSGSINYSSVTGNNLVIRTTIDQMLASGTCSLALTNGTQTVQKTAAVMQNPSSSTCEGFDVPLSELRSGNWSIKIDITSGDRSGSLQGSVTI